MTTVNELDDSQPGTELKGIGGWLIPVAIGLVFSPVRLLLSLSVAYQEWLSSGALAMFSTPGFEYYQPLLAPIIYMELFGNTLLAVGFIYLFYLFTTKKKIFPKAFIVIYIFSFLFILIDGILADFVLSLEPMASLLSLEEAADAFVDPVSDLLRSFVTTAVWVPYMLKSKRVKATFIE